MRIPILFAKRYLFSKKKHNLIDIISWISTLSITIGVASLVIVLSVYNGFQDLIKGIYSSYEPDLLILPLEGKKIDSSTIDFAKISHIPEVVDINRVIEESVFIRYRDTESIALIKGVENSKFRDSLLSQFLISGEIRTNSGDIQEAIIGRELAAKLGINTNFIDPLNIYYPSANRDISIIDPTSSINNLTLFPAGIVSIEPALDKKIVLVSLNNASNLLEYGNSISSVEIFFKKTGDIDKAKSSVDRIVGGYFRVLNKYQQRESIYKMMKTEKLSIAIILLFIIGIISFNIIGSLTMLILEKGEDINTIKWLGLQNKDVVRIFYLEGLMISLIGTLFGVILGITIVVIQSEVGILKMPGNFIVSYYPVVLKWGDVVVSSLGTLILASAFTFIPLSTVKKLIKF